MGARQAASAEQPHAAPAGGRHACAAPLRNLHQPLRPERALRVCTKVQVGGKHALVSTQGCSPAGPACEAMQATALLPPPRRCSRRQPARPGVHRCTAPCPRRPPCPPAAGTSRTACGRSAGRQAGAVGLLGALQRGAAKAARTCGCKPPRSPVPQRSTTAAAAAAAACAQPDLRLAGAILSKQLRDGPRLQAAAQDVVQRLQGGRRGGRGHVPCLVGAALRHSRVHPRRPGSGPQPGRRPPGRPAPHPPGSRW